VSVQGLAKHFHDDSEVIDLICHVAEHDPFTRQKMLSTNPRQTALEALFTHYRTHPKTLELLRDRAINDPDEQLREWAKEQIARMEAG
jgi:hypothetical protein